MGSVQAKDGDGATGVWKEPTAGIATGWQAAHHVAVVAAVGVLGPTTLTSDSVLPLDCSFFPSFAFCVVFMCVGGASVCVCVCACGCVRTTFWSQPRSVGDVNGPTETETAELHAGLQPFDTGNAATHSPTAGDPRLL